MCADLERVVLSEESEKQSEMVDEELIKFNAIDLAFPMSSNLPE
jgi:hypothetical protein